MNDIGKLIRSKREELGMTQEELAKKVGYKSRASINKIELKRDIPLKKLKPIADVLGIDIHVLMGFPSDEEIDFKVSLEEKEMIICYRNAPKSDKDMIKRLLSYYRGINHEN